MMNYIKYIKYFAIDRFENVTESYLTYYLRDFDATVVFLNSDTDRYFVFKFYKNVLCPTRLKGTVYNVQIFKQ